MTVEKINTEIQKLSATGDTSVDCSFRTNAKSYPNEEKLIVRCSNTCIIGYNVWFTSDLHFSHKNILTHCPGRIEAMAKDGYIITEEMLPDEVLNLHDSWLINKWNSTVSKKDHIYILGDFSFRNTDDTKKLLSKLNGKKFLIVGNHDGSCTKTDRLKDYFVEITQLKEVTFKAKNFPFLEENFNVFMCHYPMVTWPGKHAGVVQAHGHCHGRLDEFNKDSTDLRYDVGLDSTEGNYKILSLEDLYKIFRKKADPNNTGTTLYQYAFETKAFNEMIV